MNHRVTCFLSKRVIVHSLSTDNDLVSKGDDAMLIFILILYTVCVYSVSLELMLIERDNCFTHSFIRTTDVLVSVQIEIIFFQLDGSLNLLD